MTNDSIFAAHALVGMLCYKSWLS